jgi:hypothetical protein
MPWMGPGKRYYYSIRRVGKRMEYDYYGCGETAQLIAQMEAFRSEMRHERIEQECMERTITRNAFAELASTPPELIELLAEAKRATAEVLTAAGYHQHKRGEWRKKRAAKDENQTEG